MALDSLHWPAYENDYQLLDFGAGRRLERFGRMTLDRPCPAAEPFEQASPDAWAQADARFDGRDEEKGQWTDRPQAARTMDGRPRIAAIRAEADGFRPSGAVSRAGGELGLDRTYAPLSLWERGRG